MTLRAYESQKVQCNLTIQHTVAASLEGVLPEGATEIKVTEGTRRRNLRALADSQSILLKYKVTVYDPVLSAEVLRQQLVARARSGDMDQAFQAFAVMFNANSLQNCTFAEPRVTVLNVAQNEKEDTFTNSAIAGIVVGAFMFLVLLVVGGWLYVRREKRRRTTVFVVA